MLEVTIPENEVFNESTEEFIYIPFTKLQLEHSLISVRKWESKWHVPFLTPKKGEDKSLIQTIDYIRCMTLNKNVNPNVYLYLPSDVVEKIVKYIKDPHTATWFSGGKDTRVGAQKTNQEIITAEIIYWWMVDLGIPIELERWPLNQLLTLIKVINEKHSPTKKKRPPMDVALERARLNAERRAKFGTNG